MLFHPEPKRQGPWLNRDYVRMMFYLPPTWALDIKRNTTAFAPLPFSV